MEFQFYSIHLYVYPYVVPLGLDYCFFVISFEIGKNFDFVLFQVNLGISVPCIFSRIDFQFLQKNYLGF